MDSKYLIIFTFFIFLSIPDETEANSIVAYYSAAASTVLVAAAAVIFKALHICYWIFHLSASGFRKKRSSEDDEDPFDKMAETDPGKCYEQLICDLAVRYDNDNSIVGSSDSNSTNSKYAIIPLFLYGERFDEESPEYDYSIAAKYGRYAKSLDACQKKFSCPIDLTEVRSKFL